MKLVEIAETRRVLDEAEAARLFGIPTGFRLAEASVRERAGRMQLDVCWRRADEVRHVSLALLQDENPANLDVVVCSDPKCPGMPLEATSHLHTVAKEA